MLEPAGASEYILACRSDLGVLDIAVSLHLRRVVLVV